MRAGKLDRLVRIEKSVVADNGYNEAEAWAEFATVPAQYIPSAGKEAREQMGREAQLMASFRIRWSPSAEEVSPSGFRLRYPPREDGQVWDIKAATEVGRREAIELVALARTAKA